MSESRFPNNDEIAALRVSGQVMVSNFVCRLASGTCLILFLLNADMESVFKELLLARSLEDSAVMNAGWSLLSILLTALFIYLAAFLLIALLQSRFYLQPGRVFRRTSTFFDLGRGFSFFKISSCLGMSGLGLFILSVIYLWREFFFSELGRIGDSGYGALLDILRTTSLKLIYFIFGVLFVVLLAVFIYERISFLIRHRVTARREY